MLTGLRAYKHSKLELMNTVIYLTLPALAINGATCLRIFLH